MYSGNSPHFDKETGRFVHPDHETMPRFRSNLSFLERWEIFRQILFVNRDPYIGTGFPLQPLTAEGIIDGGEKIYWLGHASFLLQYRGMRVLTDPHFSRRASPFPFMGPRRITPTPIVLEDLPPIDVVIISHSHYDHLDQDTITQLSRLQPDIHYVTPLAVGDIIRPWGANTITELDWWQDSAIGDLKLTSTPMRHWSARGMYDRNRTQWAGWMLNWPDFRFYFIGDTACSKEYKNVADRLGVPDLAAIPIGAYEPRDIMRFSHVNPEESVQIALDLRTRAAVATHWGTFRLTLEPLDEPPQRLKAAIADMAPDLDFRALQHGEGWAIGK